MYFPAFLYTPERFNSVRDIMTYISQQMSERYDIYSSWRNYHLRMQQQYQPPQQSQQQRAPRAPRRWHAPNPPQQQQQQQQEVQVQAEVDLTNLATDPFTTLLLRSLLMPTGNTTTVNPNQFWEPIVVAPTLQEISAASTTYAAPTTLDTPCAICQAPIAEGAHIRKLSYCNHFFHKACVDNWFRQAVSCPVCRHDIRVRH